MAVAPPAPLLAVAIAAVLCLPLAPTSAVSARHTSARTSTTPFPPTAPASAVTLLAAQAPNPRLFGVNDMNANPVSYMVMNGSQWQRKAWVPANASSPYQSPKLRQAYRLLRATGLRFPGGTLSNFFNLSAGQLVPDSTLCKLNPPPLCNKWDWMRFGLEHFWPPGAFHWSQWLSLSRDVGADTSWVLNPFSMTAQANVATERALSAALQTPLHLELGNELYDRNGYTAIANVSAYLTEIAPELAAVGGLAAGSAAAPVGCPCDMFWRQGVGCWGAYYQSWNQNLSSARAAACAEAGVGEGSRAAPPLCFAAVTAHDYRLNLAELQGLGPGASNRTYLQAFLSFPEATIALNAAEHMRTSFAGARLRITEYNAFFPDIWDGKGSGPAASFLRAAPNSGAHALLVAGSILAAITSEGVVDTLNYHSFLQGCSSAPDCDPLASQPGFGILSLDKPGVFQVSAVAQVFAHLSSIAQHSTAMHAARVTSAPVLAQTFADRANMSALQVAAFSSSADNNCTWTVVAIKRIDDALPIAVTLPPGSGEKQGVGQGVKRKGETAVDVQCVFYAAASPGGWAEMDENTALQAPLPWPAPIKPAITRTQAQVSRGNGRMAGSTVMLDAASEMGLYIFTWTLVGE